MDNSEAGGLDSRDRLGTFYQELLNQTEGVDAAAAGPVRFAPEEEEDRPTRLSVTLQDEEDAGRVNLDMDLERGTGRLTLYPDPDEQAGEDIGSFSILLRNGYRVDWAPDEGLPAGQPAMATGHGFFAYDSAQHMASELVQILAQALREL